MSRALVRIFLPVSMLTAGFLACSGSQPTDLFEAEDNRTADSGITPNVDASATQDATIGPDSALRDAAKKDTSVGDSNPPGLDATPDANTACNATVNSSNAINTVCLDFAAPLLGGKIFGGHYELEGIFVVANKAICSAFVVTSHKAALDIVANATNDEGIMDVVQETGGIVTRSTYKLAISAVPNKLDESQICPAVAPFSPQWEFDNGKGGKRFRYRAPFGGLGLEAIYQFVKI